MSELKFKHVTKQYGDQAVLKGVDMTWAAGHLYGLLGRNGVGKSTLMRIVNNRTFATHGSVLLDGTSVVENEAAQNRIFLMSDAMLYPADRTVAWVFQITKALYGDFDDTRAAHLTRVFKLDPNQRLGRLSTGYKTIAKLIVALCVPCDFVLLDEPVLGLDAPFREQFYQELLATYTERPRTFVIATHLIEEIATLIDHVFVLADGRITLDEDTESLMAKGRVVSGPAGLVRDYLSGVNVLRTRSMGGMLTAYTLDAPLETPLPAGVTLEGMDLQRLFIELTAEVGTDED
ncbi:ATP-binding cassette domain-containing protein [Lacticaseibacillus daqingensis]|uniref:ATP-binding cassette domain-containing protein n=1 Tax=Lacticaseibacillus daqingensis TaxID=2486014 RepID=UPI000F7B8EDA|nr:ABC transporter ATP-binding protein [Lacticaseibacillus daqingensis]